MKTPQVTPSWSTGIYIGNGVIAKGDTVKGPGESVWRFVGSDPKNSNSYTCIKSIDGTTWQERAKRKGR